MEKEQELMLKKALLEQELEFFRIQLKLVRLFMSEQKKKLSSPSSPMSQEENVSVQKNIEQKEFNVSAPLKRKETSSPEQTTPGKDSTNPLKVLELPKIQTRVQTPITLATRLDFSLRPNGGIQIPKTEGSSSGLGTPEKGIPIPEKWLQIPNKNSKPYYIVFNRLNAVIFEDWNITKKATKGIKNIKNKKFKNFLEAKIDADQYTRSERCLDLHLITAAETLRPNTFKLALNSTKSSKTVLGSLPRKTPKNTEEVTPDLPLEILIKDFEYCYSFSADDKIFVVGYDANEKTLIYSKYSKEISPADEQLFLGFQNSLLKPDLIGEHVEDICKTLHKSTKRYNCQCLTIKVASTTENINVKAIIKEDSSTSSR
ncbi:unnamed protein product [Lactuca saligna]|uniref:Ribonuclease H1 N-terminal domain-containing protein n=1 Tax=Lactuca saligna TaxID=75948 RepID=A0AA36E6Y2_LACSI|nr:unnamed protein product [Lactuca saligna]